ncbi:MAG TPA: M48 family metalloprotease [Gemmatimonadales bacterium]|nr:M48 family metalloprotease [Gemmatimonadales bacterium]
MHLRTALTAAVAASAVACATNPVTGKSQLSLVSESQEIEMGKQAAQDVQQTIGYYDDPALQAYVSSIGMKMARASERPNLPWEFHVVNDAAVNAFALPGGFIYVTRGLLGSITNEAELATVVGHEIGHVTNRHTVQQISKQQVAQLGLGIGSILSPQIAQLSGVLGTGLQVLFLKYSRDAENEADLAGFRYALKQNWDVRQMVNMFQVLQGMSNLAGGGRLPEWESTHPDPENRIQKTEARLDTLHHDFSNAIVDRDGYLNRIKNIVYGEDPRQGYFRGSQFIHPDMRFQLTFPPGWKTQNTPTAVVAVSPQQDAMVQLGLAGKVSPEQAANQFLSQQGIQAGRHSTESINGNPAATSYFQAQTDQGQIEGLVSFISYRGTTFGVMGYTPAGKLGNYDQVFRQTVSSFREVNDPALLNVQPARVELVRVDQPMSLQAFNQKYPSTIPLAELAVINGLDSPNADLRPGRSYKRVVGGIPRQEQENAAR